MKITRLKLFPYDFGWKECLFVKVETDEGINGWGEAGIVGRERSCEAAIREIETYLLGKDPGQIELHWNTLYRDSHWRPSYTFLSALAGIEMAMWDILGKRLNVPVYALLGGVCHRRIMLYDDAWYYPTGTPTNTLADYGELALKAVDQGFRHLKWDPWWDTGADVFIRRKDMQRARECVKAVREAVGDETELLIEMHGRFSPSDAIRIAQDLEEFRPYWIEEPIPPNTSVDALAKVSSSTWIPVAAGERILTRWG
jgi:galactonate dehydratase